MPVEEKMKVELSVVERLLALGLLPQKTNYATHRAIETARMKLGFSEEEYAEFEIKQTDDGMVRWNPEKDKAKEVNLGAVCLGELQSALKALDEKKELTAQFLSLYEKLIAEDAE